MKTGTTAIFAALAGAGASVAALNVRSLGPALLNLATIFSGTGLVRDIAYGPAPWQRLDIYLPAAREMQKLPVILFFYGGRCEKGGVVKSIVYPGTDHLWIVGSLGWLNFRGPPVPGDVAAFFASLK